MVNFPHKNDPPRPVALIVLPDEGEFGPAMKALASDRQRAFVYALVKNGGKNYQRSFLEAGYTAGTNNTAAANAHRLAHDARVQEAVREEAQRQMGAAGIAATSFLTAILNEDIPAKPAIRMKAALAIMDRTGLHPTTEHKVTVEKQMSHEEKQAHALRMAQALGIDIKKLLGADAPKTPVSDMLEVANRPQVEDAEVVLDLDDWTAL